MLILKTPVKTSQILEWEDKLLDMAIGHKINIIPKLKAPEIVHGREKYIGQHEIEKYLVELSDFMEGWGRCACEG